MKEDGKHFNEWILVKSDLHEKSVVRNIKDGDVYWCAVGENVGVEINGKMGALPDSDLSKIRDGFRELFC